MIDLTNSDYIALASSVVALSALGTSIWQGFLTRKHNRLTVRPHLEFFIHRVAGEPLSIEIKNCGLGPAILQVVIAHINNKHVKLNSSKSFDNLVELLFPGDCGCTYQYCAFNPNSAISPGESIRILLVKPTSNIDLYSINLDNSKSTLRLEAAYLCLYGKKYRAHDSQYAPNA